MVKVVNIQDRRPIMASNCETTQDGPPSIVGYVCSLHTPVHYAVRERKVIVRTNMTKT